MKTFKNLTIFFSIIILSFSQTSFGQVNYNIVDDFNRSDNNTLGTSSSSNSTWLENENSGNNDQFSISSNVLKAITSGVSGLEPTNASIDLTIEQTTFDLGVTETGWSFHMDLNRNPSGWGISNYNLGFVLAANEADMSSSTVDGYAVVWWATNDELVLTQFTDGIAGNDPGTKVIGTSLDWDDCSLDGINVRVEVDVSGNWTMYWEEGVSIANATDIDLNSNTGVDNSLFADSNLKYSGPIWAHSTSTASTSTGDYDDFNFGIKSSDEVDWCNLQSPSSGSIRGGNDFDVYAQVYEPSITDAAGQGSGITAWIGYSTTNNDPEANDASWTWKLATYNVDVGNNDEYMAEIGSSLVGGTYYYASRFKLNNGGYKYGGYNGGFWDGTNNVSGTLIVDDTPDGCNIQSPEDGTALLGAGFTVYAQIWENNVTDYTNGAGQAAHIIAEIGYSTADNDPTDAANAGDWTWVSANYDASVTGTNDQYTLDLENEIGAYGTYYYVSRFKMGNGSYYYGGYNSGFWTNTYSSGSGNKSGQLIIQAPEINVNQAGTDYLHNSTYDFGDVVVGENSPITFTIENKGNIDLTFTTPLTEGGSSDYSVTTQPVSPITGSGTNDYVVTFTPSAFGTITGSVSIDNNDATDSEDPYVINFTGNGITSNTSDIVINSSYTYTSDIDYTLYQGNPISNTSNSVGVMKFDIRDGGGVYDADVLPTILDDITFSVVGIANIRDAALFDGNAKVANATNISGGDIIFTNLPTTNDYTKAPDNDIKSLTLRVSFETTVTDNEQLSFTITDANVVAAGSNTSSTFGSFADVISSTTNDRNRIEVDATKLLFVQQPTTTEKDATMNPAVSIEAVDDNNNRDLDNTATVSLTSTGTMTYVSDITLIDGFGTFGNIVHTVVGTDYTLAATTASLTNADPSNLFDITVVSYNTDDYRTTGTGDWLDNSASPAIWERYDGTNWNTSNSPSYNTTNTIYIRNGHVITSGGSFGNDANIVIESGGKFVDDHQGTVIIMKVEDGGTLKINASFTIASGGTFEVEDNGNVEINYEYLTPNTSIWQGIENFHPNSNFKFVVWDVADDLYDGSNITSNVYSGYEAVFGNIEIDLTLSSTSGDWEMIQGTSAINMNLCHNNFKLTNLVNKNINICGTNDIITGIGGDFIINSTGTRNIRLLRNGNSTFTIGGDFIQTGGDFRFITPTIDDETSICNINGNMSLTGGSINMNNAAFTSDITTTVNLKGNLKITTGSVTGLKNSSEDSYTTTSFNFTGTTTQYVNSELDFDKIPAFVKSGATVQLLTNNIVLENTSEFTVEDGGTLNFAWAADNTTPLLITDAGSPNGTNVFASNQGSKLIITHTEGISAGTADAGNVQLPIADKSFSQTAIFHYVGKANQVTGDAITTTSTGKRIIVELFNNTTELTVTNSINITNGTTLGSQGGYLEIRKGILKEIDDANDFIIEGTGMLLMSGGKYIIPLKSSISTELIPRLSGNYTITGGEIELSSNEQYDGSTTYGQILRGSRDYYSLTFSGGGDKVLSSSLPVNSLDGEVYIYDDNTQLDIGNREFSGSADLLMDDNSLFRMNKLSTVLPQLSGSYLLAGGTVEIYGTNNTQTHSIRGVDGSKGTITYYNVEINADDANIDFQEANVVAGANFNVDGIMNVNSPACFKIGATYHIGGSGTFDLKSGATLKYGSTDGIVISGAIGNIQTSTRTFNTGASYGLTGTSSPQNTGNALPASINNFYLEKTDNTDIVTLNTVQINGDMILREGVLKINSDNLTPIVCDDINGNGDVFIEAGAFLEILANKALTVEGTIYNTQGVTGLVLKSDATGTGSLIQSNSVVATVERYITGDNWHTMFPTLDAIPKSTYTSEGTQTNNNFYSYDETTKDYWNSSTTFETTGWISEVGSGNLRVDKGFIYNRVGASTRIVSQTGGGLFVGNKDFTITNTTNSGTIDNSCASGWSNYDGWNLVGNPYASAINWDKVTKTGIENAVYVYDDSVDKYKVYGTDNYSGVGTSTGGGSQFIPSGQGFYVKKTSSGSSTFTLDATTSDDREHSSQEFLKVNSDKDFIISNFLRLEIEKDGYNDDIVIRTLPNESGVTCGHDSEFDAYKMFAWNNDKPQLYSKNTTNSNYYAINSLPTFTENTIVPLGVHIGVSGEYEINLTENYFDNMHIWLEDRSLFVNTNLLNTSSYTFSQVAEQNNDRFYLHFDLNHKPVVNINIPDQITNVNEDYLYVVADNVFTDVDFEDVLTITASLADGNALPTWLSFNSETMEFSGIPENVQVINVKLTATDEFGAFISQDYKLTVKSAISVGTISDKSVSVYPNPANDKITIELSELIKSKVSILDLTGKELYSAYVNAQKSTIDLSNFAKGVYFVKINVEGQTVTKKIVIE